MLRVELEAGLKWVMLKVPSSTSAVLFAASCSSWLFASCVPVSLAASPALAATYCLASFSVSSAEGMNIDAPTTCTITMIETKATALRIVMTADGLRGAASATSSSTGGCGGGFGGGFFGFWFVGHGVAVLCVLAGVISRRKV